MTEFIHKFAMGFFIILFGIVLLSTILNVYSSSMSEYVDCVHCNPDVLSQFSSPVTFALICIGIICVSLLIIICLVKRYLWNDSIKEDEVNE